MIRATPPRHSQLPSTRAWRDRLALAAVAGAAVTFSAVVDVHERLHRWAEQHEPYDPYRLLPVAVGIAVVTVAYLIATRRRLGQEVTVRQEREQALTQALRTIDVLSGLLAMCASCKRIRDDDGGWEPVEAYLQRHGDVSVSHGLCPTCVARLYPDHREGLSANRGS